MLSSSPIHYIKGFLTYGNFTSQKVTSCMISQIRREAINKKSFGLDKIKRLNLNEQQINKESRFYNFYIDEPKQEEKKLCKARINVSLIPNNFLNIIIIPDKTEISFLNSNKELERYDLNDLEYFITGKYWEPLGLQHDALKDNSPDNKADLHEALRYATNYSTFKVMLGYMRTKHNVISNNKSSSEDKFCKDYMSCLTINKDTIIKNNGTNEKQVYCAIQDDRVIGVADMTRKEDLEEYFK